MTVDLVAVQAFVRQEDYFSEAAFQARLRSWFSKIAAIREDRSRPALVVFPEMLGAFLGLLGRGPLVQRCRTTDEAMQKVALDLGFRLLAGMWRHHTLSLKRGLFLAMAAEMHRVYLASFSALSREFGCYVVAGSLLLPENRLGLDSDRFEAADSRIYNTSFMFDPEGRCVGVTRKVNLVPTQEDTLDLSPGPADRAVPVEAPFGRVGTAICYDAFKESHTSREPRYCPLALS